MLATCCLCFQTIALAEKMCQAQRDAVSWVNNLVNSNWGTLNNTVNYDGSTQLTVAEGDLGEPQCVDIIAAYWDYFFGPNSFLHLNAYQYANIELPEGWTYSSTPEPGDIVVWGSSSISPAGHIAIVVSVENGQYWYVDTNGGSYTINSAGYRYNEGATRRGPKSISDATTYIHPLFELNDAEKHELQIIETAQGIYDQYTTCMNISIGCPISSCITAGR